MNIYDFFHRLSFVCQCNASKLFTEKRKKRKMKRCKVQKLLCTRPASKPPLMLFKSVHSLSLSTFSSQKKTLSFSNHRIGSLRALDAHSHRYRLSLWYSSMITRCQDCSDPYRRYCVKHYADRRLHYSFHQFKTSVCFVRKIIPTKFQGQKFFRLVEFVVLT